VNVQNVENPQPQYKADEKPEEQLQLVGNAQCSCQTFRAEIQTVPLPMTEDFREFNRPSAIDNQR
jgi:hypothetical protein